MEESREQGIGEGREKKFHNHVNIDNIQYEPNIVIAKV